MTTVFEEQNISKAVFRMGLPAMKRFVKCFFELLTQALVSAAGNGAGKGA